MYIIIYADLCNSHRGREESEHSPNSQLVYRPIDTYRKSENRISNIIIVRVL